MTEEVKLDNGARGGGKNPSAGDGLEPRQYLTFTLCSEMFGIGILRIREIIEFGALTPVPMMPDFIRGVINLRGAVVPVIDLAARFGRGAIQTTRRTCVVIVEVKVGGESQTVGVMVDSVSAVIDLLPTDIEMAPSFGARIRTEFIEGMGRTGGRFMVLLDLDRVLDLDELTLLTKASLDSQSLIAA